MNKAPTPKTEVKAGGPPSGFYIYIGPNIPRLIRSNTIYRGNRAHVLNEVKEAVEKYPLVKKLLIPGDQLPTARMDVKKSGEALHASYVRLSEQVKLDRANTKKE